MDFQMQAKAAPADDQDTTAETSEVTERGRVDFMQLSFWVCLLVSIAAASVALAWPNASGAPGPILLIAMASGGLVFLLWSVRGAGRMLGLFPERGSIARAAQAATPRFGWIEALDESVLIADQGGAPVAANTSYRELTSLALIGSQVEGAPVTVDRLFGANPGLAAPVYRLSKGAKAGHARREILPPITIGPERVPAQFEITVSPLPRDKVLWRIRPIAGEREATGAADLKSLYVEDAPMGFFAARPDGTITYANGWLRDMLGLPETAKNIRIDDIMRPEFVKMLSRDRKSGVPGRVDIQLRGRDGVERPVQAITTWSGKGADATGRTIILASQQVMNTGEEGFRISTASRPPRPDGDPMFDDAPFGAVRLEGGSVDSAIIMDANRSLMDLTEGKAAPGGKFSELFAPEEGEDALKSLLIDAIDKPVNLKLIGEEPKHVNVFVALDGAGHPSVAYVMDITEQRQLEMRLAHGEKMQAIGQLAGGVAHDFNNVLQGIILNNEQLMVHHPLGDPSYSNLKSIHEFSIRAKDLVKMLLAYARQQTFKREVFAVTDFMSEFSILLRQLLDERIELDVKHGRDVPYVKADKNQLENALFNLATNARDAMLSHKNGGKLTIRTARATGKEAQDKGFAFVSDGDYMLIEVEDSGHGMPKDVMDKIFQPFFTTKEAGVGTGLGLATVYGIIKQSGGYICTTSSVGKGTTFHIYLPALKAEEIPEPVDMAQAEKIASQPVDISGRGRILLIEDEDGVRGIAASLLRSSGYEVEEACDGEEAMEILEDNPESFDLVISDVVMPGKDGPTLIREAKDLLGHARVIFISGYAERDIAKQLDDDRAVSFLPKPFTVRQLAERVKQELGSPKKEAA
ncbi:histidine kinase [Hyphomonas sp. L-53-1-40]|uniref:response regulator n=1 Tax=Hyphomonas sp. L-53-1-40 TaxID=1207058 RepID=UPI000458FDC9|nr:response regulator [Hyphomonas sp. L-53-1-40]KCZ62726.1 histidine kinase [Hyphomonas sp. L-53-1-40]